jgi:hypothetical protein
VLQFRVLYKNSHTKYACLEWCFGAEGTVLTVEWSKILSTIIFKIGKLGHFIAGVRNCAAFEIATPYPSGTYAIGFLEKTPEAAI